MRWHAPHHLELDAQASSLFPWVRCGIVLRCLSCAACWHAARHPQVCGRSLDLLVQTGFASRCGSFVATQVPGRPPYYNAILRAFAPPWGMLPNTLHLIAQSSSSFPWVRCRWDTVRQAIQKNPKDPKMSKPYRMLVALAGLKGPTVAE